jgi:hypothetical protein
VIRAIENLMKHDTAGDPMTRLRWTRRTTSKISRELRRVGIRVSPRTVARLLKQLGYSLRVNHKKRSRGSPKERDRQFRYIQEIRENFESEALPVVSIDSKKKELVGRFKNPGTTWEKKPVAVLDHDFRSDAKALVVPYGVLDLQARRGRVLLALSHDTAALAVDGISSWWSRDGRRRYPEADHLLVLADAGGSNGARIRAFKHDLQHRFCDRFGVAVTVCHYPPGASKWNPIDHRLFSAISQNWQGRPLESLETVLNYIRTTTTETGLTVGASLTRKNYPTGVKISDEAMAALSLHRHPLHPMWNYTILPSG